MEDKLLWLPDYLKSLSNDLDVDVVGEYLTGLFLISDNENIYDEVEELLSAYVPAKIAKSASNEIVKRWHMANNTNTIETPNTDPVTLEDQMRSLMQADCERIILNPEKPKSHRDAYTIHLLRSAGVSGYEENGEEERELEVAVANSEFKTKQRLNSVGSGHNGLDTASETSEAECTDLDDIEQLAGYGEKDGIKAGTVDDALSILNPSLKSSNFSNGTRQSALPTALLSSSYNPAGGCAVKPSFANPVEETKGRKLTKKKCHPASKHISKVGAKAEEKYRQSVGASKSSSSSCSDRIRRDEIEDFLFDDIGYGDDKAPAVNLPEGGRNHERVAESDKQARQVAAEADRKRCEVNKANRAKQLEEANQRKQAAQKRAQKHERHRF